VDFTQQSSGKSAFRATKVSCRGRSPTFGSRTATTGSVSADWRRSGTQRPRRPLRSIVVRSSPCSVCRPAREQAAEKRSLKW